MNQIKAKKTYASSQKEVENKTQKKAEFSHEIFLMGFMVQDPDAYKVVEENLIDTIGLNEALEKFYNTCKNVYNRLSVMDIEAVKAELSPEEAEKLEIYSLLVETHYPDFSKEATLKEVKGLVKEINQKNIKALQNDYIFRLKNAKNQDEKSDLLQKYHQILSLKGQL